MNRRWDRKLTAFAIAMTVLLAAALVFVVISTGSGVRFSVERIAERAEEGYRALYERVCNAENVSQVIINRKGKFEDQKKYRDFDPEWLSSLVLTGYEYDADELAYDRTLKFALRRYDTENVYHVTDGISVYTKFSDECVFYIAGDTCYVSFMDGETEYRFAAECAPLTGWLKTVD